MKYIVKYLIEDGETMKQSFFVDNRKKLMDMVENGSIVILFSGNAPYRSADQKYPYTPNRNFYYLTGLERENFILFMFKKNDKVEEMLFIENSNPKLEKWIGKKMTKGEAEEISGIKNIQFKEEFQEFLAMNVVVNNIDTIYLDLERREWNSNINPAIIFANEIRERYPYINIKNIYKDICNLRTIKQEEEIERIKKAINITKEGLENVMKNLKPNMMEYQAEAYFDFTVKSLGIKNLAFKTIAASGVNGTILHYEQNNCKIADNSLILFDLGVKYENYCSDISRTYPVNGKFTERQKQIYNIVLKAQLETIRAIRPGMPIKKLNEITKDVLIRECKKIGLINEDSEITKYYYHGVSHYLGLDTHDVGSYERKLEPGMVLTVEPGLYIEEEGIGIRIEDDVLVTEDGCEVLSKDIIKTVEEIEEFMKNK
ncbi:aminopeptidase P . Metallo peptidase. MEROPS family M24B [Caloranaerobacter azorensis DSM 13643]|uniref:Xaa-Pro aminopeptidase n=2 Tax=Caloranaerobacter azorensis TaxID=116090 RepID=A0A1M5SMR6_9FIRM|nr:aminopeptidase P . Metallo peptidase. MEROPS family M24B [Caloranaerobacter azorensis DSM 13643]